MLFRRSASCLLAFVLVSLAATALRAEETATPTITQLEATAKERAKSDAEYYELFKVLADTMDQVERNYVKDVSRRELMEAAIHGVLSKLDPYSNYIGPNDLGRFKVAVENQFTGIGIQLDLRRGQLTVLSPIAGSPAYKAGIQAGDVITEIEDESTEGIHIDEAVRRLKGEAGTSVKISRIVFNYQEFHRVVQLWDLMPHQR